MNKIIRENFKLELMIVSDSESLYQLIQKNKTHLTQNGDYSDEVKMNREQTSAYLQSNRDRVETYGIKLKNNLIGTVTLTCYEYRVYGLGYWMDVDYLGKGYMGQSIQTIIEMAREQKQAKEIWAGITHSNKASIKLVEKLGFKLARKQAEYNSYKLVLPAK